MHAVENKCAYNMCILVILYMWYFVVIATKVDFFVLVTFIPVINEFTVMAEGFHFTCIIVIINSGKVLINSLVIIIAFANGVLRTISISWSRIISIIFNSLLITSFSLFQTVIFSIFIKYFNIRRRAIRNIFVTYWT